MHNVQTRVTIAVILVLILGAIFGYGIYLIREKNEYAHTLVLESESVVQKSALAQSMRILVSEAENDLEAIHKVVLPESELVTFIEQIERILPANELSIRIESVQIDETQDKAMPRKVLIDLSAQGEWEPAIRFLHALEHLPHPIDLGEVVLTRIGQGGVAMLPAEGVVPQKALWNVEAPFVLYIFK